VYGNRQRTFGRVLEDVMGAGYAIEPPSVRFELAPKRTSLAIFILPVERMKYSIPLYECKRLV
jgi:hypothetical protein